MVGAGTGIPTVFVLDRDFQIPSRPRSLFPPSTVLIYSTSCPRPDCSRRPAVRPFRIQSDLSVENGPFRLNEGQIRLSYTTVKKRAFSTQLFSTENSDWRIQSKNSVDKVIHVFFEPIESLIRPPSTHPHGHTATHLYQYHTAVSYKVLTLAWPSLLLLLAESQRGAFLVPLVSSVYHTTAAARGLDPMLCCQQWLRLLWLWWLSAECNSTNVALAAFGSAQSHQLAGTKVRRAVPRGESARSTELPTDFACCIAVLPHTNRL